LAGCSPAEPASASPAELSSVTKASVRPACCSERRTVDYTAVSRKGAGQSFNKNRFRSCNVNRERCLPCQQTDSSSRSSRQPSHVFSPAQLAAIFSEAQRGCVAQAGSGIWLSRVLHRVLSPRRENGEIDCGISLFCPRSPGPSPISKKATEQPPNLRRKRSAAVDRSRSLNDFPCCLNDRGYRLRLCQLRLNRIDIGYEFKFAGFGSI
jgi:hypothetical protein